jgi:hypothetical protein
VLLVQALRLGLPRLSLLCLLLLSGLRDGDALRCILLLRRHVAL